MAITYNKLSEKWKPWGIDVTVEFLNDDFHACTKIFIFKDLNEIKDTFEDVMEKALSNVQDDIDDKKKPKEMDIYEMIKDHFKDNTELTKEDFDTMKIEDLSIKEKK